MQLAAGQPPAAAQLAAVRPQIVELGPSAESRQSQGSVLTFGSSGSGVAHKPSSSMVANAAREYLRAREQPGLVASIGAMSINGVERQQQRKPLVEELS